MDNLAAEREVYGHYRNLVSAATGVGKTIIAAFDYKAFKEKNPRARLLFVAHRKGDSRTEHSEIPGSF